MTREEFRAFCIGATLPAVLSDEGTAEILGELFDVLGDLDEYEVQAVRDAFANLLRPDLLSAAQVVVERAMPDGSIETIPTDYDAIHGLLGLLGYGGIGVPWVKGLSVADRRRLANLGVALWKTKGLPDGTRGLCRVLLGGGDVVERDYPGFGYRADGAAGYVLEDGELGGTESGLFHASDPYQNSDFARLVQALYTVKAAIDSWQVVRCLLADSFLQGLKQWTTVGTPVWTEGNVDIGAGEAIRSVFGSGWLATGRVIASTLLSSATYQEIQFARIDASNYIRVRIYRYAVSIQWVVAGAATTIATGLVSLPVSQWLWVDIRISTLVSADVQVDVLIDGELAVSGTIA